jgi:hypothetical protein
MFDTLLEIVFLCDLWIPHVFILVHVMCNLMGFFFGLKITKWLLIFWTGYLQALKINK